MTTAVVFIQTVFLNGLLIFVDKKCRKNQWLEPQNHHYVSEKHNDGQVLNPKLYQPRVYLIAALSLKWSFCCESSHIQNKKYAFCDISSQTTDDMIIAQFDATFLQFGGFERCNIASWNRTNIDSGREHQASTWHNADWSLSVFLCHSLVGKFIKRCLWWRDGWYVFGKILSFKTKQNNHNVLSKYKELRSK